MAHLQEEGHEVNLLAIPTLARTFDTVVGLSDHTMETVVPVGLGRIGRADHRKALHSGSIAGWVDRSFSLNPAEFKTMVEEVRKTEKALGTGTLELTDKQRKGRRMARSLFAVRDIAEGEEVSRDNVRSIRPGLGLAARYLSEILGRRAQTAIP